MNVKNLDYIDESNGLDISTLNKEEFELLHSEIRKNFNNQSKLQKLRNVLLGIKFNMEDYISGVNLY